MSATEQETQETVSQETDKGIRVFIKREDIGEGFKPDGAISSKNKFLQVTLPFVIEEDNKISIYGGVQPGESDMFAAIYLSLDTATGELAVKIDDATQTLLSKEENSVKFEEGMTDINKSLEDIFNNVPAKDETQETQETQETGE